MASTALYTVQSPVAGQEYIAPSGFWVIPDNATSISVEIKAYNSGGGLQSVSSLTAIRRNVTGNADAGSFTQNSANEALSTGSNSVNGTNVFAPAGKVASACDHFTLQITSYSGRPYLKMGGRRGGGWNTPTGIRGRRSGGWNTPTAIWKRLNNGTWTQVG